MELLGFNPTLQPNLDWKMRLSHSDSKEVVSFRFEPRFVASSFSVLIEGLLSGLGAAALPGFMVQEHVREKKLVSVLPKWMIREEELLAVYLQKKFMPARLRALIDHLKENPVLR